MTLIRTLVALATLPALAPFALAQPGPAQDPCSSPEHRQFDFWIGDWVVTTPDGQTAGENTIEAIQNGCVLMEDWRGAQGSTGQSFNMYYAREERWYQTWVDGAGGRLDLTGGLDADGRMVLSGVMPGREGGEVLHEISWTPREDGTVLQHWRASRDGGETWSDLFQGVYARRDD